jgi:endonuclease-3 related protein
MGSTKLNPSQQERRILEHYRILLRELGPQHWWPAHSRFEVIVGAFLVQNTAWANVEHALRAMRRKGVLTVSGVRNIPLADLEALVRPSGYFRQKARRLKTFVDFLDCRCGGSLTRMFRQPTEKLRAELLDLDGVGPETADSILLYAGQHAVFVVDAYARRIFERHAILEAKANYESVRQLVERALGAGAKVPSFPSGAKPAHRPTRMSRSKRSSLVQAFNDMHGLLVAVGKTHCGKSMPSCQECPLRAFLPQNHVPAG